LATLVLDKTLSRTLLYFKLTLYEEKIPTLSKRLFYYMLAEFT